MPNNPGDQDPKKPNRPAPPPPPAKPNNEPPQPVVPPEYTRVEAVPIPERVKYDKDGFVILPIHPSPYGYKKDDTEDIVTINTRKGSIVKHIIRWSLIGSISLFPSTIGKDMPVGVKPPISRKATPNISKYLPTIQQIQALKNPSAATLCKFTDQWYQTNKKGMEILFTYLDSKDYKTNPYLKELVDHSMKIAGIWNSYRSQQGILFRGATNEATTDPDKFIPNYLEALKKKPNPAVMSACGSTFDQLFALVLSAENNKTSFVEEMVLDLVKAIQLTIEDDEDNKNIGNEEKKKIAEIKKTLKEILDRALVK